MIYSSLGRRVYERAKKFKPISGLLESLGQSHSLKYVQGVRQELNDLSPSFCAAKWLQSSIHLGIGETHSCHHPVRHKISTHDLESNPASIHNTYEKIKARQEMLRGERPKECSYCWNVEDQNELSDRYYKSAEPWARNLVNLKGEGAHRDYKQSQLNSALRRVMGPLA